MKFFNVKTAIAAVCVVAAGFGGVKAYNVANQSEADLLLAENVEALSAGDDNTKAPTPTKYRWIHIQQGDSTKAYYGLWEGSSEPMDGAKHDESHSHGYSECSGS